MLTACLTSWIASPLQFRQVRVVGMQTWEMYAMLGGTCRSSGVQSQILAKLLLSMPLDADSEQVS